jgi:hypothetical protein
MDIYLSKFVLLVLFLLPGYLALKGSARIIPLTQRKKSAAEAIAEGLVFNVVAHVSVAILYTAFWILAGLVLKRSSGYFIGPWFQLGPSELLGKLGEIPTGLLVIYLFFALAAGWFLGLGSGLIGVWRPMEHFAARLGIISPWLGRLWFKHVERFLITGGPTVNDALFPDLDEKGDRKAVFVEIVLLDKQGTLTGKVASVSMSSDAEDHRLIYLQDAHHKRPGASQFKKLDGDGVLVNTEQAATIQIKQV